MKYRFFSSLNKQFNANIPYRLEPSEFERENTPFRRINPSEKITKAVGSIFQSRSFQGRVTTDLCSKYTGEKRSTRIPSVPKDPFELGDPSGTTILRPHEAIEVYESACCEGFRILKHFVLTRENDRQCRFNLF